MELITSHTNIDFDGLASILAAQKLYPKAKCIIPTNIENNVSDFLKNFPEIKKKFSSPSTVNQKKVSLLILVDTQEPQRLGELSSILKNVQLKIHIYDHHPKTPESLKGEVVICKDSGATITLLIQKLIEKNIKITSQEATIFALGIYEDTGSLTYMSTTPDDLEVVAYLLKQGADLNIVSQYINRELTPEQLSLLNELLRSSKEYKINNIKIVIAKAMTDKYVGDLAIIAHRIRDLKNLDVLFFIVKMNESIYLVARSRKEEVDVGEIAREFGGGGHPTAASASLKDISIEEVEEKLFEVLNKEVRGEIKAENFMTAPVISLNENTTIEEAKKMMIRFNHTGFPVVRNEKIIGIITRQDMERASLHGLGKTSISNYMSKSSIITASPDAILDDIHNLMLIKNIGRVPIINKDKKIVGIVTRTDVLQVLQGLRDNKTSFNFEKNQIYKEKNFSSYLKSRVPHKILEILIEAGKTAQNLGFSVYVVGGFVRDLFMGKRNFDIDLVVEGNGIIFAEKFSKAYKGEMISYYKFGTAVIIFPDKFKIDIATARTEFYDYPTALPTVQFSSIKYDLYRRDFTINAIAIKLNPDEFGQLVDFFGGIKDMKSGVIRVLYNLSFIDDPTRIFRAIRFEQRLNFKIDKQTEHFIDNALKLGVFDKIANQRVRDELIIILSEEKPINAVRRMEELNVLTLIHPQLKFDQKTEKMFNNLYAVFNWYKLLFLKNEVDFWIIYFSALIHELNEKEIDEILKKFKFTQKEIYVIEKTKTSVYEIIEKLKSSKSLLPSQIYLIFHSVQLETILFIMAFTKNNFIKKRISMYLTHYQDEKIFIKGDDLISLGIKPGAEFKNILEEILYAKLDGKIKTKEDEMAFAEKFCEK